jgi:hypothetical protein
MDHQDPFGVPLEVKRLCVVPYLRLSHFPYPSLSRQPIPGSLIRTFFDRMSIRQEKDWGKEKSRAKGKGMRASSSPCT